MRINPVKKKLVYHYSKFAPKGKTLKIRIRKDLHYYFRSRTADRNVIKEVWARKIYERHGFDIQQNDTVVDLGGHIGVFSVLAAKHAINGTVYAFEPMKDNYEVLLSNVKLNELENVVAENIAVSKESGESKLYLSSQESAKKVGYITGGHSLFPSKERDETILVETETLDSVVKRLGISSINYLKIDTEGSEFDILYTASKGTLDKIQKIVMELHPFGDHTAEKMIEFLSEHGFSSILDRYGDSDYMLYSKK